MSVTQKSDIMDRHYLVFVFNVMGLSFKVRGLGMQGKNVRSLLE
jgi:hypothetical protein